MTHGAIRVSLIHGYGSSSLASGLQVLTMANPARVKTSR